MSEDITKRIEIQNEKERLLKKLGETEKMVTLGQFVATIAHEINNPLDIVINKLYLIEKYHKLDQRIKIIQNNINKGLPASLNKGIKIAKGKYIARQDSDDVSLKNRLEKQQNLFLKI